MNENKYTYFIKSKQTKEKWKELRMLARTKTKSFFFRFDGTVDEDYSKEYNKGLLNMENDKMDEDTERFKKNFDLNFSKVVFDEAIGEFEKKYIAAVQKTLNIVPDHYGSKPTQEKIKKNLVLNNAIDGDSAVPIEEDIDIYQYLASQGIICSIKFDEAEKFFLPSKTGQKQTETDFVF